MQVSISDLRHRMTIEQAVMTPDGGGGFTQEWEAVPQNPVVYAALYSTAATDTLSGGMPVTRGLFRILIRHRGDVKAGMRMRKGDDSYYVVSAQDKDGRQSFLDIAAEKR